MRDLTSPQNLLHTAHLQAISVAVPIWMQEVNSSYEGDDQVIDLLTQLSVDL